MKLLLLTIGLTLTTATLANTPLNSTELEALLSHPERPAEDSQRDPMRLPVSVMAFAGVASGQTIVDLFAGAGWYTELFSHAVGSGGKVYAQNDKVIWQFAEAGIKKRTADNRLANVQRFDNMDIVDMELPPDSVDVVFTALNYHDMFFTEYTREGKVVKVREDYVDYRKVWEKIASILKDDGVFVIVDHHAEPGSGYAASNDLHRIDANIVKFHAKQAGFDLVEQAYYLENPADDHSLNVFAEEIRGKTDRFIFKFTPAKP